MKPVGLSAILWAFALVGCANGFSSTPAASSFNPSGVASSAARKSGKLVVQIEIPRKTHKVRVRVMRDGRPAYVSAATKAMKIVATNGSKSTTVIVPLTPASPGCTTTSGNTSCTVNVVLRACPNAGNCYTAVVSTYDAVFCNGAPPVCSIPASAKLLSSGQSIPFRVATGKNTSIDLTLSGVPHSMSLSADALTRANGSTFDLIGPGAHAFTLQTIDADGNVLVGPGAPTFAVSAPAGGLAPVAISAPPASPNQVWVAPPATLDTANTATFQITPSFAGQSVDGCKQPGASCAPTSVTVDMEQMAVVLGTNGVLEFFALDETTPRLSLTGLDATANGLAADAAGDIFTPNGLVAVYTPPLSAGTKSQPACCPGATTMAVSAGPGSAAMFLSYFPTAAGPQSVVSSCSATACSAVAYILRYAQNQALASNAEGDLAYGFPSSSGLSPCSAYVYAAQNYGVPAVLTGSPMNAAGCATQVALDTSGDAFATDPNDDRIVEYSRSSGYHVATQVLTGANTPVVAMLTDASGNLFDVVSQTVVISTFPYQAESYIILQETLASSLSAHQGGSLNPDLTSTVPTGDLQVEHAAAAIETGAVYVQFGPGGGLVRFAIPGLARSVAAPSDSQIPTGLLILP